MSPPNLLPLPGDDRYRPVPLHPPEKPPREEDEDAAANGDDPAEPLHTADADDRDEPSPAPEETQVVIPPDGGWGWMVVLGSFLCNMIVDGIIFTFGMFLDHIAKSLDVTTAKVALVGSLLSGFYLIVGPFASALANRFGFRTVALIGSVVGSLAFAASYFAMNWEFLCVMYGVVGGIGFGLVYVPAVITVGYYFERWRALATGIAVCGSGIGAFIFPPICTFLIESFGWRSAILCEAAIVLSCGLFGATFRPVTPTTLKDLKQKAESEKPKLIMDKDKLPLKTRLKMERILELSAKHSTTVPENQSTIPRILGVNNNSSYPTASDVYHTISYPEPRSPTILLFNPEKRLSVPLISEKDKPRVVKTRRFRTESESRRSQKSLSEINRPLYREDIFFGASLSRLPKYTSQNALEYNLSVTRLPTKNDILEEQKGKCKVCPEAVRRALATLLDFSLLKSPCFIILAVSGFFTMMGFYVPFMYLRNRATQSGFEENTAVWLVSTIGIANTVGRLLTGGITSLPGVNALWVNNLALSVGGLVTIFSGLSMSHGYQFLYSVVFGISMSCFASLRSILVVEFMGLENLTNAFGLLLLFQGIAACIGAPVAGLFYDATGSYNASFYIAGSLIFLSAVMCYPLSKVKQWEERRKGEKNVPV